jgi:hypothetical protein
MVGNSYCDFNWYAWRGACRSSTDWVDGTEVGAEEVWKEIDCGDCVWLLSLLSLLWKRLLLRDENDHGAMIKEVREIDSKKTERNW